MERLPGLQSAVELDYRAQAQSAHGLGQRVESTRREAERVALEEIERTRRLHSQLLDQDPRWQEWRSEEVRIRAEMEAWEGKRKAEEQLRRQEIEGLKGEGNQLAERVKELELQLQQGEREWQAKQQHLNELRQQRQHYEQDLGQAKQSMQALESTLNGMWGQAGQLGETLEGKRGEVEGIRSQLSMMQSQLAIEPMVPALTSTHQQEQLDKARADLHAAQRAMEEAERAIKGIPPDTNLETIKQQSDEAFQRLADQVRIRDQCRQQFEEAKWQAEGDDANLNTLEGRRTQLQQQLESIRQELMQVEGQIGQIRAERYNRASLLNSKEQRYREACTLYDQLSIVVQQLNQTREERERQAMEAQERRRILEAKHQEAEREVQQAQQLVQQCEGGLRQQREQEAIMLKQHHERMQERDRLQATVQTLEADLKLRQSQLEQLQSQYDQYNKAVMAQSDQLEGQRKHLDSLQHQFNSVDREVQSLEAAFGPTSPQANLQTMLQEIRQRLADNQHRLNQLLATPFGPDTNPWSLQWEAHQARKSTLEQAIRNNWLTQPPIDLQRQLHVEAEAIMRAELAKAVELRQGKIMGEADALASIHVRPDPHFDLDETARSQLIAEHQDVRIKEDVIAGTVLNMCKESHIHA